jgi:hypothetical protein
MLTVMVMGESNVDFSATEVKYGGQTMTKQTEKMFFVATNRSYCSIFTLNEAGISAATTGDIAVTWSTVPSVGSSVCSVFLSDVDQTNLVGDKNDASLVGTTVATPALTTEPGDMVIMCGATENNVVISFDNDFASHFESNTAWGDGVCGNKTSGGGTETPSFTQSAAGRMALCAIVVKKGTATGLSAASTSTNFVKVYPNPVSKMLYINQSDANSNIKIFDVKGQLIYTTKSTGAQTEINVKDLNCSGLIFVQVRSGLDVSTFKVSVVK